MHAVENPPALRHVEPLEQKRLEIASRLRLAGRQRPLDRALKGIGRARGISGRTGEEIGRIPDDGKANAFDKALLSGAVGERGQVCALSELPVHLGDGETAILQEAGARFGRTGFERLIAWTVVKRLGIGPATVRNIDQQRAIAALGIFREIQYDLGRVFDQSVSVPGRLVDVGDFLRGRQLTENATFPEHELARCKVSIALPGGDLQPGQLRLGGSRDAKHKRAHRQDRHRQTKSSHQTLPLWRRGTIHSAHHRRDQLCDRSCALTASVALRCSAAMTLLVLAAYTMCDPGNGYRRARTSVTVSRVPGLPGKYRPKPTI